jgi:hypothetical protein
MMLDGFLIGMLDQSATDPIVRSLTRSPILQNQFNFTFTLIVRSVLLTGYPSLQMNSIKDLGHTPVEWESLLIYLVARLIVWFNSTLLAGLRLN